MLPLLVQQRLRLIAINVATQSISDPVSNRSNAKSHDNNETRYGFDLLPMHFTLAEFVGGMAKLTDFN